MQKMLKRLTALLLAVVLLAGLLPVNGMSLQTAQAEAAAKELEAQSRNADALLLQTAQDFAALAATAEATLAAEGAADDGEWQYVLLPEYGYAVITGHHDSGHAQVDIPATLSGADVVALLSGVFADHPALTNVTMAHNVYYAAPGALPKGVTVRGYNGSYAQKWASENRCAFENLSELDFAIGVVDCSDVAAAHYVRHSESSVSLRALEASRLQVGSVFFLADPNDLYAVSFYRVTAVGAAQDGFVTFTCETPEIQLVLNSFELTNAPMVPDWDTVEPAEDVSMLRTMPRGAESGLGFQGMHFTPSWDLGKKGKFELDIGLDITSNVSVKYAGLKIDYMELTNVQTLKIGGKIEVKDQLNKSYHDIVKTNSMTDRLDMIQAMAKEMKGVAKAKLEATQPLCTVTLLSVYGILNVSMNVQFNITYSGSIELNYTTGTTTTYTYQDGKLTATSHKNSQQAELKAEAEVKGGVIMSLKMSLTSVEFASIGVFLGLKATAEYGMSTSKYLNPDDTYSSEMLIQGVEAFEISPAALNMMDCIDLSLNFVVEVTAKIGNDWLSAVSMKATILDLPFCELHYHWLPRKFCMDGTTVTMQPKSFSEILHLARNCPMSDSVQLMVPTISKTEPMGSVTLYGATKLTEEPELELPEHHVRVTDWYRDEQMTNRIQFASGTWDLPVKSGDKLYGRTEQVGVINVINYKGETMKLADGSDAIRCLANTEALNLGHLDYENDHIIGWVEVKSPTDLTFVGNPIMRLSNVINGDLKDHTWLALCDNDLTIEFRNEDNQFISSLTTGHFVEIAQEQVPAFPVKFDPAEAVAVYEWRDKDKNIYEFPKYIDGSVGDELVLHMTYVDVQRVFEEDETPTIMGTEAAIPSGLTTYSSKNYYNYITTSEGVVIKGFKSNQSYVDEEGVTHEWTAVPEVLVIPSYIDDKPVTIIEGNAFQNTETLVSVKLPSTIERIGASAFRNCPNLLKLDISSCSKLTSLPDYFAYGDTALTGLSVPGSVTSIGSYAFAGCTGLTAADINASIGASAFEGCTSLSSVTLRYRVSAIGANAFKGCTALTALTVPCSAATVGNDFIRGCTSLRSLTFDGAPDSITSGIMNIGEGSSLATLTIGLGVTTIGANAFSNGSYGNPNLTTITLPEALREVGSSALRGTAVEKLTIYDLGMLGTGFASSCTTLRELSFETGTINSYAFDGCTNLEKIHIGNSVYAIGDYAFRNCTSLTEVVLGDGVEYLGTGAFDSCTSLVSVELGNKLRTVGDKAFYGCSALEALHFPPTVKSFGVLVMSHCTNLRTLSIGGPETPELNTWHWLDFIPDSKLETVIINEGVTSIGFKAFANSFTISHTDGTDYGHKNLKTVILPSTIETIDDYAFDQCSSLVNLTLPKSVKSIGDYAFKDCGALTINIPQDTRLQSIGKGAFYRCSGLKSITLGSVLTDVGDEAFYECTSLEALHFPPTVKNFGVLVMSRCTNLRTLSIGGPETPELNTWHWLDFIPDSKLETVIINEGVTSIGFKAFANSFTISHTDGTDYGHKNLKTVILPSTIETIDDYAFDQCSSLVNLTLPKSVKSIGNRAFQDCSALTINIPQDTRLQSIGDGAFYRCSGLKSITLGSVLTNVGDEAFYECTSLEELHFPPTVKSFGVLVMSRCTSLRTLSIGGPETPELNTWHWLDFIPASKLETVIINEGVTSIGFKAFANSFTISHTDGTDYGHKNLKTVILPSTIETIDDYAFDQCSSLVNLTLPKSVKSIGNRAFQDCSALTINIPQDTRLQSIGDGAFYRCYGLKSITLGSVLTDVGDEAFYECTSLEALHFPPTVKSFGVLVMSRCTSLRTLSIGGPETPELNTWHWLDFIPDSKLETVIINEGVTSIGFKAFANSFTISHTDGTDYGHKNLKTLSLPSTLKHISEYAFDNDTSLNVLNLPSDIETIADNAFINCNTLTEFHSPTYSTVIAEYAESIGVAYTCDDKVALTIMEGETTLYTGEIAIGTDIRDVLAACVPADHDAATFCGWFMNAECTATWTLDTMPAFPLTLYAGMVPVHTVTFNAMSGDAVLLVSTTTAGEGFVIPWPEEPVVSGYRFEGWYTDAAMTTELSADTRMGSSDMTVYGRMTAINAGAVYTDVNGGVMLTRFALMDGAGTEVWLPSTVNGKPVVAIAANAFADASAVTRLHLPDSLQLIESGAFNGLENLEWFTTGPDCVGYKAINGVLYTADLGTLVYLPQRKPTVKLTVPDTVHTIAANACARHVWLQTVELGVNVTTIEAGAFMGCDQLVSFTAYGLEYIAEEAIPFNAGMTVTGPVKTGALRSYFLLEDGAYPVFKANYNLYPISLYVAGSLVNTIGLEAGSTLSESFLYGPMGDGTIIHTWFTDRNMTIAWNRTDATPESAMSLYAPKTNVYDYEVRTFTVGETTVSGAVLTAYNGQGGALVLPRTMGAYPVMAIGESFLAHCQGRVTSVQIGSEVIEIADTALNAPAEHPFGSVVLAESDSYAAQWAAEMGYTVNDGLYTLIFETNGGASIAPRQVTSGAWVRLPVPVRSGSAFLGWYLDAKLTIPVELTDDCYVTPGADVTLYAAWDGAAEVWPFTWEEQDGSVVITAYTGNVTELTIPETINGLNVTAIKDFAFVNATLNHLILPDTLESIGMSAFAGAALTSIDLGGTKEVNARAFAECTALSSVTMRQVTTLGSEAFAECSALTTLHLPATLTDVHASAFRICTALTAFTVETESCFSTDDGTLLLGNTLLRYPPARQATEYALPDGITCIGAYAFADAAFLTSIILPDTLEEIGMHAFDGCTSLTAFTLTDEMAVTNVPESAFSGCSSLRNVTLSSSVTSISQHAFHGCDMLAEIHVPASVTDIDRMAFSGLLASQLSIVGDAGSVASNYAAEHGFAFVDPSGMAVEALFITNETSMLLGDVVALTVQAEPADAALSGEITWSSSAPEVVYIYGSEAHAIAAGTSTITATAPNGVSVSITMEVRLNPIVPSAGKLTLLIGQQVALNLDMPAGGIIPACKWQSAAPEVAEAVNGNIHALTAGTTDITCTLADGRSFCIPVRVVDSLTTLAMPQALTVISEEAFLAAESVERVVLSDHVTSIGSLAFAQMLSLQQALLPASVTNIADDAFAGCDALVILCERDSTAHTFALAQGIPYVLVAN